MTERTPKTPMPAVRLPLPKIVECHFVCGDAPPFGIVSLP